MDRSPPGSSVHVILWLEYWSGLPSPFPGDFPDPGMELCLLCLMHWQLGSLPLMPPGKLKASLSQFSRSGVYDSVTPWTTAHQASLPIISSFSSPKPMSIESVMPSNYLILCHPLLLLPSIFPSIRVFSSESALHIRWPRSGVSASASVLPMNTQDWYPLGWTGWISLQSKGLSRVFSNTTVQKHQFFCTQLSSQSNSHIIHDHWINHNLD